MKKIAAYLIPVLACFAVGISASFFQASSIAEWYPTLTKPTLTPPNIVFPIAWSVLYLCMGLSLGRLIVRRQHKGIIRLWVLQLIANFLWSILFFTLRNPLADYPMAALASLGAWQVLLPATAAAMGYLIWRRRWMAAAHWLAALAFGLALTMLLGATVDVVRPIDASSGFGFPSVSVTMATITFGFFAVLIAREMPGRTRVWPYLVSGIVVSLIGFSRLYLGAHWLSDVIGGMLFGTFWLLVLGIAYRRRFNRSFWVKPVAWLFYGVFAVAAMWYAPRNIPVKLERFEPTLPAPQAMDKQEIGRAHV